MLKDQLLAVTKRVEERPRRKYSETERQRIVEETEAPGMSVSVVARRYNVNANLVFKWRQRYGRKPVSTAVLLPVTVEAPAPIAQTPTIDRRRRVRKPTVAAEGVIEIEFSGGHRMRVHGAADASAVRQVIELLSR